MENLDTFIWLILVLTLLTSPISILLGLKRLNVRRYNFIIYLVSGIVVTSILTIILGWWSSTSNVMLLSHYGYNYDAMNNTERLANVSAENLERVKNLEKSSMGIGWPLKTIITFLFYFPYLLITYIVIYLLQKVSKTRSNMMKKTILLTLGILIAISGNGQDLQKQIIDDKFYKTTETFFVLKSNQQIRHGEYKRTSGKLKTIGQYEDNRRTGVWKSFGYRGELIQTIDFSNHSVTPNDTPSDSKFWIYEDNSFSEVKPDQAPAFIGGYSALYQFISFSLRYPADARRYGIQGKVLISVIITKEGRMTSETIESGIGHGANEEALRVMKLIPDEWIPGLVNGEPKDIKMIIPITFKLG